MRGCWFVKFIKNNQMRSLGKTKALAAPTRAKVAHKHVESKSVADALRKSGQSDAVILKEKELWDRAAESVLEYQNEEGGDSDASVSEEEINYDIDA